jgi:hypothetical protein
MKFSQENSKDIQKYFQGTFVKFLGLKGAFLDGAACSEAGELVHSIDQVQGSLIKGKRWENGESTPFQFMLYPEKDAPAPEVEFILPKKSYFNIPAGGAALLFRIPARQYRRGICADNVNILGLNNGTFFVHPINHETIGWYIQKPQFFGFGKRDTSYAVSRRMAVDEGGRIYVDQNHIGTINYAKNEILVQALFIPEVYDILRERGQTNYTVLAAGPATKVAKGKQPQLAIMDDVE